MRNQVVAWILGICALSFAPGVFANGFFQMVKGDVRASVGTGASLSAKPGQRFQPGTSFTTGPNSQAILRFDDGQSIVLSENSEFRLDGYNFNRAKPQEDNISMQILKGALRSITGLIGARSRSRFALIAPQATIGVRGTDFMVALANQGYVSVSQGSIALTNAAGTVGFGAGTLGTVAGSTTLATTITAGALPASVSAAFGSLSSVTVGAAAGFGASSGGAGAGGASAGAAGAGTASVVGTTAAAIAVGVAGVASATNKNTTVSNH
jgi:hypothetical protein